MKSIFWYIFAFLGLLFLMNDTYFSLVYFKILGLILVMFSVYNIQAKIPSKFQKGEDLDDNENEKNV
tara:strand:+ start:824 stop:1024 length:201 start_codon:yes stop_codon:yes gene_type:complete